MKLWDVATGRELANLKPETRGTVRYVAFTPDGKTLAAMCHTQTVPGIARRVIKLWDVATRQELATLSGHRNICDWIAFAPDGKTFATGSHDRTAKLWDAAARRERVTLTGHMDVVMHGAFSPDGKTLATASWDGTVKLWHVASGQELATLKVHTGKVESVAFAPDGKTLATGSSGLGVAGEVSLWRAPREQKALALSHAQPDPEQRFAFYDDRAREYVGLRFYNKAVTDLEKALSLVEKLAADFPTKPEYRRKLADTHELLGRLLAAIGRTQQALDHYRKVIELDPKLASAHNNLGIALRNQGKLGEAIACYRKAVALVPQDCPLRRNLALLLSQRGRAADRAEAIMHYRKAIELMPNDAATHNNFAWLLANCPDARFRDPVTAVAAATKAVKLAPKNGDWWNTLGVAHYRAGDWKAARAALRKSTQLRANGGDAHDWLFLAMSHRQLGEKDQARAWYGKAVPWMAKNLSKQSGNHRTELGRFRAEAEALLGIPVRASKPARSPVAARKLTK
jgi:tetratricopeptide (TPR) repeat protein